MRNLTLILVIFAVSIFAQSEDDMQPEYCHPSLIDPTICQLQKCNKANTRISTESCPIINCSKVIGTKGDPTKPYPDCCITPICGFSTFQQSPIYYRPTIQNDQKQVILQHRLNKQAPALVF